MTKRRRVATLRRDNVGNEFIRLYTRQWEAMRTPPNGRPPLNIPLMEILEAVRATGNQSQAVANLGYSGAPIRKQIRLAGLTLAQVLAARDLNELLPR